MDLTTILTTALLLTILVEWGVLLLLGERRRRVLWASVAVNILTNVPLNLFFHCVNDSDMTILVGEAVVVAVEALWYLYFLKDGKRALVYSVLCNAVSFLTGLLLSLLCVGYDRFVVNI